MVLGAGGGDEEDGNKVDVRYERVSDGELVELPSALMSDPSFMLLRLPCLRILANLAD